MVVACKFQVALSVPWILIFKEPTMHLGGWQCPKNLWQNKISIGQWARRRPRRCLREILARGARKCAVRNTLRHYISLCRVMARRNMNGVYFFNQTTKAHYFSAAHSSVKLLQHPCHRSHGAHVAPCVEMAHAGVRSATAMPQQCWRNSSPHARNISQKHNPACW